MGLSEPQAPLFVDLDGTLTKTDCLLEAMLAMLRSNPLSLLKMFQWLSHGRAYFKKRVAEEVDLDIRSLPVNSSFLTYLEEQKSNGRQVILISAAHQTVVEKVAECYPLFDQAIGSDGDTNLKSEQKLDRIKELSQGESFAYAGNSEADLVIWRAADEIVVVNAEASIHKQATEIASENSTLVAFDLPSPLGRRFLKAMRPHQWLKNFLVFLPLILSHQLNQAELFWLTFLGFMSFSLCASSVYLLNDMLDIEHDRHHPSKSSRPFASGTLSLRLGFLGSPALFLLSVLIASSINGQFLLIMIGYWMTTCLYSFYLKRLYMADALTLSLLYTLRIIAGSAAIGITTTQWLLAFSGFLFLGLALLKRTTELRNLQLDFKTKVKGRSYDTEQLNVVAILGVMSSIAAIIVFTVYINAPATTELYSSPATLWMICPALVIMHGRVWLKAYLGDLDEDPVLFASHDRFSQVMLCLCGALLWLAI
ncbi:MAG: UbiA family prenyltransferase [Pseudohongiellaceae bacterium]